MNDVIILSQAPQQAADTITFAAGPVEHIELDTYAFTGFNTEGLELAIDVMLGNLQLARQHEREDVRAWMKRYVEDILSWSNIYQFVIDLDTLVMIAAKDRETEFHSTDEIATAAMEALDWSYLSRPNRVTRYAIAALRTAVLNAAFDAASLHVDYTGDEDGSMYVDYVTTIEGLVLFKEDAPRGWTDDDGEIARAASDLRGMEGECRNNPLVTRVNTSDYNIAIFEPAELGQSTSA